MSYVHPETIVCFVNGGTRETEEFMLHEPPTDTITATVEGGNGAIRLQSMWATIMVAAEQEDYQWGDGAFGADGDEGPPSHRDDRNLDRYEVEQEPKMMATLEGQGTIESSYDWEMRGVIEFVAADLPAGSRADAVLKLRGTTWAGLDIRLQMVVGVPVSVELGPKPVAYRGATTKLPATVSLAADLPDTTLRLSFSRDGYGNDPAEILMSGGQTRQVAIPLRTDHDAPLGTAQYWLGVNGSSSNGPSIGISIPVDIATEDEVILFRTSRIDATGVPQVHVREVLARTTEEPVRFSGLKREGDSFSFEYRGVDESGAYRFRAGVFRASAKGRVQVATVKSGGSFDADKLTADGFLEAHTLVLEGEAQFDTPVAVSGSGSARLEGPSASVRAGISPERVDAHLGVSAGEVGGVVGITIGGTPYGVGAHVGLKAEVGFHWGGTTTIKLPVFTISGPNPAASLTSFAIHAAIDLVTDPLGTALDTGADVINAGKSVVDAVGSVLEAVKDVTDGIANLLGLGDDDPNIGVTSDFGNHQPLAPGAVYID